MKKVFLALLIILIFGCNSSGGGGGGNKNKNDTPDTDPCAGPVPCLTEDWKNSYAIFYDNKGAPAILGSNGKTFALAFNVINQSNEMATIGLSGPAVKCRSGNFNDGVIDYNMDGTIDDILLNVVGKLSICFKTLDTSGIEFDLNDLHWLITTTTAYYDGMSTLSVHDHSLNTDMPVHAEDVTDIKDKIGMVKELLNIEEL